MFIHASEGEKGLRVDDVLGVQHTEAHGSHLQLHWRFPDCAGVPRVSKQAIAQGEATRSFTIRLYHCPMATIIITVLCQSRMFRRCPELVNSGKHGSRQSKRRRDRFVASRCSCILLLGANAGSYALQCLTNSPGDY